VRHNHHVDPKIRNTLPAQNKRNLPAQNRGPLHRRATTTAPLSPHRRTPALQMRVAQAH